MTQEGKDWLNDFLEFLYVHYTGWDVPLNTFFEKEFVIDPKSEHRGVAIRDFLNELQMEAMITWVTQPVIDHNKPITLEAYKFNARLTFTGLTYIQGYISNKKRDKIEKQNVLLTGISIFIAFLTAVFIG